MAQLKGKYLEDGAVTLAKQANITTASIMGRKTAGDGIQEVLSKTDVLSLLNVEDGANAYTLPTAATDTLGGVKVDGTTITITEGVISAVAGDPEVRKVEVLTIDATAISNKYIDLAQIPTDPTAVNVVPVGGIAQEYTVDFTVITDGSDILRLNWDGLGLESLLEADDKVLVTYTY